MSGGEEVAQSMDANLQEHPSEEKPRSRHRKSRHGKRKHRRNSHGIEKNVGEGAEREEGHMGGELTGASDADENHSSGPDENHHAAAVKIQSLHRGRIARKESIIMVAQMEQEEKAQKVTKIQAMERGRQSRKRTADKKQQLQEEQSAVKIQALARGRRDRAKVKDVKDKQRAEAEHLQGLANQDFNRMQVILRIRPFLPGEDSECAVSVPSNSPDPQAVQLEPSKTVENAENPETATAIESSNNPTDESHVSDLRALQQDDNEQTSHPSAQDTAAKHDSHADGDVTSSQSSIVKVMRHGQEFQGKFDVVLGSGATQEEAYASVRGAVLSVTSGINAAVFTYGQTGTGKTFTMLGDSSLLDEENACAKIDRKCGVIPRALSDVFAVLKGTGRASGVTASYLEVYNDKIKDLLSTRPGNGNGATSRSASPRARIKQSGVSLEVRIDGTGRATVPGATAAPVADAREVMKLIHQGNQRRTVRATDYNHRANRSHTILRLSVESKGEEEGQAIVASLFLVDLAGSEKFPIIPESGVWKARKAAGKVTKEDIMNPQKKFNVHIGELAAINSSLMTLGKCIEVLAHRPTAVIPYRESKLTMLLKDALGGNCRTAFVATVSPSIENVDETLSTLKFAAVAKKVVTHAEVNESFNLQTLDKQKEFYETKITKLKEVIRKGIAVRDTPETLRRLREMQLEVNAYEEEISKLRKLVNVRSIQGPAMSSRLRHVERENESLRKTLQETKKKLKEEEAARALLRDAVRNAVSSRHGLRGEMEQKPSADNQGHLSASPPDISQDTQDSNLARDGVSKDLQDSFDEHVDGKVTHAASPSPSSARYAQDTSSPLHSFLGEQTQMASTNLQTAIPPNPKPSKMRRPQVRRQAQAQQPTVPPMLTVDPAIRSNFEHAMPRSSMDMILAHSKQESAKHEKAQRASWSQGQVIGLHKNSLLSRQPISKPKAPSKAKVVKQQSLSTQKGMQKLMKSMKSQGQQQAASTIERTMKQRQQSASRVAPRRPAVRRNGQFQQQENASPSPPKVPKLAFAESSVPHMKAAPPASGRSKANPSPRVRQGTAVSVPAFDSISPKAIQTGRESAPARQNTIKQSNQEKFLSSGLVGTSQDASSVSNTERSMQATHRYNNSIGSSASTNDSPGKAQKLAELKARKDALMAKVRAGQVQDLNEIRNEIASIRQAMASM